MNFNLAHKRSILVRVTKLLRLSIYAFILTRSSLGLLHAMFRSFVPELWPLIYAKISFPLNILRTNWQNFTKFYICIHIDKIYIVIVTQHFLHICTRVMALNLPLNFVSIQYLENKLSWVHQILYMHSYWQDLRWDCYKQFFCTFVPELWPLIYALICSHSISWELIDSIVYVEWSSRVNFVTIFGDLYQNTLWFICNNLDQFAHLSSASDPSNVVIKMAAIMLLMYTYKT